MSLADDASLLAMDAAKMSAGSIAFTMGWTERRVERRLAELKARAAAETAGASAVEAVQVPQRPVAPLAVPKPPPVPKPRPLAADEGLVTRTFALSQGGRGAAVVLGDSRLVFTETGRVDPELGGAIKVKPGEGVFHMIPEKADA